VHTVAGALNEMDRDRAFIPSKAFKGVRPGFVFQKGEQGLGYHEDIGGSGKRKKEVLEDESLRSPTKRAKASIVDSEEEAGIALTDFSVSALCKELKLKAHENMKQRVKFEKDPTKFMGSEIELDEQLSKLKGLASKPKLYLELVKNGAGEILVNLISHPNEDLSKDVLSLIAELLDVDVFEEAPKETSVLLNALVENHVIEVLVSNLERMNTAGEAASLAVFHSMDIVESIVEIDKTAAQHLAVNTTFLDFLIDYMGKKESSEDRLSCSERLLLLVASFSELRTQFLHLPMVKRSRVERNLLERLTALAVSFKTVNPMSVDEEEYVANLYTALQGVMLENRNRDAFLQGKGMEELLAVVKLRRFAYPLALRVIEAVVEKNATACEMLIDAKGLKTIFPLFMGKSIAVKANEQDKSQKKNVSEVEGQVTKDVLSIITNALLTLEPKSLHHRRIIKKFKDDNCEKMDRALELFVEYHDALQDLKSEEYKDPAEYYLSRVDHGLEELRHAAIVIANLLAEKKPKLQVHIESKLFENRLKRSNVSDVLREFAVEDVENSDPMKARILELL